MGKKLQRTAAKEWRQNIELQELPSGNVAELKRLNLVAMIAKHDDVPNFLLRFVNEKLNGKPRAKVLKQVDPEISAKDGIGALLWMAKQCFVYPKLVDGEPQDDDEVCIDDISMEDLMFVMDYAIGDASLVKTVERFRDTQNSNVESLPAGNVVEDEAG